MFKLTRFTVGEVSAIPNQQSWPIRVVAKNSPALTPAKIFVYQTAAAPIADRDFFSCVAGAAQLDELPADSGSQGIPFYRTDTLVVNCRSAEHASEFWDKIQKAVQDLADNLALVDALALAEEVTILPHA